MADTLEETRAALVQLQDFDVRSLPRRDQLGASLSFDEAVAPAEKVIRLYSLVPASTLSEFPEPQLAQIRDLATQTFGFLEEIRNFDPNNLGGGVPKNIKATLNSQLVDNYDSVFQILYPLIAYAGTRSVDFGRLEADARNALQSVESQGGAVVQKMEAAAQQADSILESVRKLAEEQGVSQQAIYFKNAADSHEKLAVAWRQYTIYTAVGLGVFAFLMLFAYNIPFLDPKNNFDAAQMVVGKVFVFAVIAYMLVLCARNFLANTHNAIVNRHRQNALVTFQALADAAGEGQRDVVLAYAAACIFGPQETGFSRTQSSSTPQTLIELLPRLASGSGHV